MDRKFPDIDCPVGCIPELFQEGYHHALKGLNLTEPHHYKKSFRFGFRAGMVLRRRTSNVRSFPYQMKLKIT